MKYKAPNIGQMQNQPMPSLNPNGGTTPVPVALIDQVMPTLRDTELRVLFVVVRQTLGWQVGKDPYLRKERAGSPRASSCGGRGERAGR